MAKSFLGIHKSEIVWSVVFFLYSIEIIKSKMREVVFSTFSDSSSKWDDDLECNATNPSSMTPCSNIILALQADVTLLHRTIWPCTTQSNLNNNSCIYYKRMTTNLTSGTAFRQIFLQDACSNKKSVVFSDPQSFVKKNFQIFIQRLL